MRPLQDLSHGCPIKRRTSVNCASRHGIRESRRGADACPCVHSWAAVSGTSGNGASAENLAVIDGGPTVCWANSYGISACKLSAASGIDCWSTVCGAQGESIWELSSINGRPTVRRAQGDSVRDLSAIDRRSAIGGAQGDGIWELSSIDSWSTVGGAQGDSVRDLSAVDCGSTVCRAQSDGIWQLSSIDSWSTVRGADGDSIWELSAIECRSTVCRAPSDGTSAKILSRIDRWTAVGWGNCDSSGCNCFLRAEDGSTNGDRCHDSEYGKMLDHICGILMFLGGREKEQLKVVEN
jgi:hypothetical protein